MVEKPPLELAVISEEIDDEEEEKRIDINDINDSARGALLKNEQREGGEKEEEKKQLDGDDYDEIVRMAEDILQEPD